MTSQEQVEVLAEYVGEKIGDAPTEWPGGWPDDIEAALIDAVFSVRARYGSRVEGKETGVYGAVTRWRDHRGGTADDLEVLAETDAEELRKHTNKGRSSRRSKAEIVIDAARALRDAGIRHASDFGPRQEEARRAYLSVRGCGHVTWNYFRMLLGYDDVKPDTWVMKFVQDVLPDVNDREEAKKLVVAVSERLGVEAKRLDHAIWWYRRGV